MESVSQYRDDIDLWDIAKSGGGDVAPVAYLRAVSYFAGEAAEAAGGVLSMEYRPGHLWDYNYLMSVGEILNNDLEPLGVIEVLYGDDTANGAPD
jgi:hypothetical protein